MPESSEQPPVGVIFNTNSKGRFDLVVYDDGLLAVKGTYVGVAIRAAGPGGVGVGGGGLAGAAAGAGAATTFAGATRYEAKRLTGLLESARAELAKEPNFFIAREQIVSLELQKRWYGHSLTVRTNVDSGSRRFDWKPRLNRFDDVEALLRSTFGDLVAAPVDSS